MADTKLTGLSAATSIAATDLLYVVADPAGTPTSKKAPASLVATNPLTSDLYVGGFSILGANATEGGDINIRGGFGGADGGGSININGGDSDGTGPSNGGGIYLYGGNNEDGTGDGGPFEAGGGYAAAGAGGRVRFVGGEGGSGVGGNADFESGGGSTDGGGITFTTGSGTSGNGGDISFSFGAGGTRNGLFFPNLPTSDPGVSGAAYVDGSGFVKISP